MTRVTDGTLLRVAYQIEVFDSVTKEPQTVDAGREFVAIDGIDVTERGAYVNVVEPDEYGDEELESWLVVADVEALEVVGSFV